ncbi:GNAT family N-acetyltransferase [Roseovarius aquimarinus]|uniref:L-ornithine N(alpha)-acyltransferase n=1 Tax=Roseovarius aquimarinus TaxID=1229156 RepID=A0ABW7I3H3_9RHOB
MPVIGHRRYVARVAGGPGDLAAAQALRGAAFGLSGPDRDPFDARCTHILIEDRREDRLVACFRLADLRGGEVDRGYTAQFYDLSRLAAAPDLMTELGRFCIQPAARDPDILRTAWGAIAAHVDASGTRLLFGCTSFRGTDPAPHRAAFAALAAGHLAPGDWAPGRRARHTLPLTPAPHDAHAARAGMPPLLRSYLGMGGRIGDHAVIDPELRTIHVFTGLEIAAIPAARKARLRAALDGARTAR